MSQDKVDAVGRAYAAVRRRDVEGVLAEVHPDMVGSSYVMNAESQTFHGHDGMRQFLDEIWSVFPDWWVEVVEAIPHGEALVARLDMRAHGAGSGVPLAATVWQVVRFREGRIASWHGYPTEAAARAVLQPGE